MNRNHVLACWSTKIPKQCWSVDSVFFYIWLFMSEKKSIGNSTSLIIWTSCTFDWAYSFIVSNLSPMISADLRQFTLSDNDGNHKQAYVRCSSRMSYHKCMWHVVGDQGEYTIYSRFIYNINLVKIHEKVLAIDTNGLLISSIIETKIMALHKLGNVWFGSFE